MSIACNEQVMTRSLFNGDTKIMIPHSSKFIGLVSDENFIKPLKVLIENTTLSLKLRIPVFEFTTFPDTNKIDYSIFKDQLTKYKEYLIEFYMTVQSKYNNQEFRYR